jgi:hypothetical protein
VGRGRGRAPRTAAVQPAHRPPLCAQIALEDVLQQLRDELSLSGPDDAQAAAAAPRRRPQSALAGRGADR